MPASQKIKILSPDLANKIAAGEVVERPASVVKELVENAIDAGATEISIILNRGGTELIRVVDNGNGMSDSDLKLAFQRHATSKIRSVQDLEAITSLGFRGEALASIASISRVEARSVVTEKNLGLDIRLEGGKLVSEQPAAGTRGTAISVKNLFYNTPARRKFLKAESTEWRRCLEVATRFALCYPALHFTLVHNGVVIWEVLAQSLDARLPALLGKRVQDRLIAVEDDSGAVRIHGFVGTQDTVRRNSGEQFLFLNGRFIVDRSLNHAVIAGYGEILAHGGYPLYVLHLDVDPARVDINVHPTKMQVKFADDRLIYSLLRGAVKRNLRSAEVIPGFGDFSKKSLEHPLQAWQTPARSDAANASPASARSFDAEIHQRSLNLFTGKTSTPGQSPAASRPPAPQDDAWLAEKPAPGTDTAPHDPLALSSGAVWQLHAKYLIVQTASGLLIIDQHAAHERILYERAMKLFKESAPASQKLLFPVMVELGANDSALLKEVQPYLEKLGFLINDFGDKTVVIEGVPAGLKIKNHEKLLQEMLDDYRRGKRNQLEVRDNVARVFACHSSIRTGDRLNAAEIQALLEQLFAAETPYFCPHGRPVIAKIDLDELDKRFGRL